MADTDDIMQGFTSNLFPPFSVFSSPTKEERVPKGAPLLVALCSLRMLPRGGSAVGSLFPRNDGKPKGGCCSASFL